MTIRPAALFECLTQGATPEVRRAAALSSATPAPADAILVEAVAIPGGPNMLAAEGETGGAGRRNDSGRIGQSEGAREQRCLAEDIYFEARGEPDEGQAAVAQVVQPGLERPLSGLDLRRRLSERRALQSCQFSFACEDQLLRIRGPDAWLRAERIAAPARSGKVYVADTGSSTHFHAVYVRPRWARRLEKMDVIGHHVFCKLKPGQS